MKWFLTALTLVAVLAGAGNVYAQARNPQFEAFGGVAIPLAPDVFKDYYKLGFSGHGQYVMFPSPTVGISFGAAFEMFTFDGDKFLSDLEDDTGFDLTGYDTEGNARVIEFGVGVRPYLTPATASTQFFLFAMGTMNLLHTELTATDPSGTELVSGDDDETKFGIAGGAGIEIPAGESMNLIIQGLARSIFADPDNISFIGVTAGLVF